jgi:hypothetical protein
MKNIFQIVLYTLVLMPFWATQAQKSQGIGTALPNVNALLELRSTAGSPQGLLLPRMSTADRNTLGTALSSVTSLAGMIVYDHTLNQTFVWTTTGWAELTNNSVTNTPSQWISQPGGKIYTTSFVGIGGGLDVGLPSGAQTSTQMDNILTGLLNTSGITANYADDYYYRSYWGQKFDRNGGKQTIGGSSYNGNNPDNGSVTFRYWDTGLNVWRTDFLINARGDIGVGTTSANQRLSVVGNSSVTGTGYFGTIAGLVLNGAAAGSVVTVDGTGKLGFGALAGGSSTGQANGISYANAAGVITTNSTNFAFDGKQIQLNGARLMTTVVGSGSNFYAGYQAGGVTLPTTTGTGNNFLGYQAGLSNTIGANNNFLGPNAGLLNMTGSDNNFLGGNAGRNNTTGYNNNFMGNATGALNTTGYQNNFFGIQAGYSNTTGYSNNFFGMNAGYSNSAGFNNNFFGMNAGYSNSGSSNNFFGPSAGQSNTTGYYNNFMGSSSGFGNTTGHNNNFLGYNAGYSNTTGSGNNFMGIQAGLNNTSGSYNSFIGLAAGDNNSTGSYNIAIGSGADMATNNLTNAIAIGKNASVGGSNMMVLGGTGSDAVNVGIGTATPSAALQITGSANLIGNGDWGQLLITQSSQPNYGLTFGVDQSAYSWIYSRNFGSASMPLILQPVIGNVGIGTTTPGSTLTVKGNSSVTGIGYFGTIAGLALNGAAAGSVVTVDGTGKLGFGALSAGSQWISNGSYIYFNLGDVGIGTTTPTNDLSFGPNPGLFRTIQVEDDLDSNPGTQLNIQAGGAKLLGTNIAGGDLYLASGRATGNTGSNILFQTATPSASGNSTNAPSSKMVILGNGNVGIGTLIPNGKLDVNGSIILNDGITNASSRPAVTSLTGSAEIRGYSSVGLNADDGFLRISAGGGTNSSEKSYIDLTGYSTVSDMYRNIVLGVDGKERMRISSGGNISIGDRTNAGNGFISIWLRNNSGVARRKGEIVITESAINSFNVSTSYGATNVIGVLVENCSNGSTCRVAISGVTDCLVDGGITSGIGQHVITGSNAGRATSTSTPLVGQSIGVWLQSLAGSSTVDKLAKVLLR